MGTTSREVSIRRDLGALKGSRVSGGGINILVFLTLVSRTRASSIAALTIAAVQQVIAALDDAWLQFDGDTFISAGDEPFLQFCNELELSEQQYEVLRGIFDVEKFCNLCGWIFIF